MNKISLWFLIIIINALIIMGVNGNVNASSLLIGVISGAIGLLLSSLILKRYSKVHNKSWKNQEIEYKDERNTYIRQRAKAKTADIMQWSIMGVAFLTILLDMKFSITLILVGLFIIVNIIELLYMSKYNKEF
ncbi:MAG: DUF2178 domain-containing protein [Sarcina sp.]